MELITIREVKKFMILKQQQKIIHLCTALRYELEDTKATRATEKLTQQVIEYLGALAKQMENEPFMQENGNKNNDNVKDLLVKYGITTSKKLNAGKDKSILKQSYNFVDSHGYDELAKVLYTVSKQKNVKNKQAYLSKCLTNAGDLQKQGE